MSASFSATLLLWYSLNKRDFPWRKDKEFYPVYLSEVMLQQTRASAVIPYYERFLKRFPDMESFASSDEDEYLKLWEGLGYYSRVRNFHSAISFLVETKKIPSEKKDLLSLKGVGPYTASILLAICFSKKEIAVDGNLFRIFSRLTCCDLDKNSPNARKLCYDYFLKRLEEDPGSFNQALMDLGEMVCLPHGAPLCGGCPLKSFCKAYETNTMSLYPRKPEKKGKPVEEKTVLLVQYGDEVLLHRRGKDGLLASLYEYVLLEGRMSEEEVRVYLEERGLEIGPVFSLGEARHVFSHKIWEMCGYKVVLKKKKALDGTFFASRDEVRDRYALPSAFDSFTCFLFSCRQPEV